MDAPGQIWIFFVRFGQVTSVSSESDKSDLTESPSSLTLTEARDTTLEGYEDDEKRIEATCDHNSSLDVTTNERRKLKFLKNFNEFIEGSLPMLKTAIERLFLNEQAFSRKYKMKPEKALCEIIENQTFSDKLKMYDRIRLLNNNADLLEGYPLFENLIQTVLDESKVAFDTFNDLRKKLQEEKPLDKAAEEELLAAFKIAVDAFSNLYELLKRGILLDFKNLNFKFMSQQFEHFRSFQVPIKSQLNNIQSSLAISILDKQEEAAEYPTSQRSHEQNKKLHELHSYRSSLSNFNKLKPKIISSIIKLKQRRQRMKKKNTKVIKIQKDTKDKKDLEIKTKTSEESPKPKTPTTTTKDEKVVIKLDLGKSAKPPITNNEISETDHKVPTETVEPVNKTNLPIPIPFLEEDLKQKQKQLLEQNSKVLLEPSSQNLKAKAEIKESPKAEETQQNESKSKVEPVENIQKEKINENKEKKAKGVDGTQASQPYDRFITKKESDRRIGKTANSEKLIQGPQNSFDSFNSLSSTVAEKYKSAKSYAWESTKGFLGWLFEAEFVTKEELEAEKAKQEKVEQEQPQKGPISQEIKVDKTKSEEKEKV